MAEKLKFSEEHLWVRVEATKIQLGITDHLQVKLGEIIGAQLPDVGDEIEQGEPFGEVESQREVHELLAPISGIVVAINTDLEDHPAIINEEPYHDGWLMEIEPKDDTEIDDLMDADEYEELVTGETEEEEEDEEEE